MIIKSKSELQKYNKAAQLSTKILKELYDNIKIGVNSLDIEKIAQELCKKNKVKSAFMGVGAVNNKYKYATCISVNDAVVHGIPTNRKFRKGDIVKVDFGIIYQGLYTDHCFTIGLGPLSKKELKLIKTAKKAVLNASRKAIVGKTVGDLGYIMNSIARTAGFDTVKEFVGHGIGHSLHEPPQIYSFGNKYEGIVLEENMVLCVEAQLVEGSDQVYIEKDGWTVKTVDQGKSAMFEFMVVVEKASSRILTPTMNWPILIGG